VRGNMNTVTASQHSMAGVAAAVIRYGFYFVGAVVLSMIGVGLATMWSNRTRPVDDTPAFHVAAAGLAQLPVSGHVVISERFGRVEVRQYGTLRNRQEDLAAVMVMPPKGIDLGTQLGQDLDEANLLLRNVRVVTSANHYDIETRFGSFERGELFSYIVCAAFVELVLVEVGRKIRRIELVCGYAIEHATYRSGWRADGALIGVARECAFEQEQIGRVHQRAFEVTIERALRRVQRVVQRAAMRRIDPNGAFRTPFQANEGAGFGAVSMQHIRPQPPDQAHETQPCQNVSGQRFAVDGEAMHAKLEPRRDLL